MNSQDQTLLTVSPSRISVYRTCPKWHHYQYTLGLQKRGVPTKQFDKGNYFHELLHVYYRYIQSGVAVGSRTAIELMHQRVRTDLERNFSQSRLTLFDTVLKQFDTYIRRRSIEIDQNIEVLGVEEEIKVPVELPSGRVILLHGFLDLYYRRRVDGEWQYRIRDHKTESASSASVDRSIYAWGGVGLSPQLLFYLAAKYVESGVIPVVEISWINTKDYKAKNPSYEESFALYTELHSEISVQNYLNTTLQLIDEMLDSNPLPHYDEKVCKYCPFKIPCIGERKGIPSDRILESLYVSRTKPRERTLT